MCVCAARELTMPVPPCACMRVRAGRSQPQHHVAPRGPADGALARLMVALGDACFLAWSGRGLAGPMHLDRAMDLRAFVKLLAQHVSAFCFVCRLLSSRAGRNLASSRACTHPASRGAIVRPQPVAMQGVTLKADDALWWDLQPFLTPTPTSTAVDVAALAEALSESSCCSLPHEGVRPSLASLLTDAPLRTRCAAEPDVPDFAPVDSAAIAQDLSSAARGAPHDAALVRRVVAALGPATRAMAPGLQGTRHVPWRRFEELCSQHGAAATPHLWSDLRDLGLATMSGFHSIAKHPASSSSSAPKPPATVVDFERLRRMVGPDGPTYLTGHRAPPSPAPAHAAAGPAPPRPPAQTSAAAARLRKRLLDSLIAAGYAQVLAHALQQSVVRAAKPLEQHRAAAAAYKVAGAAAAAAAAAAGRPRSPGASLSGLPPPAAPQDVATLAMGAELAGAPPPVGVPRDGLLPWRRLEGLLAAHGGALDPPLGPQDWSDLHAVGALKVTQTDTLVDWVRLCTEIREWRCWSVLLTIMVNNTLHDGALWCGGSPVWRALSLCDVALQAWTARRWRLRPCTPPRRRRSAEPPRWPPRCARCAPPSMTRRRSCTGRTLGPAWRAAATAWSPRTSSTSCPTCASP